MAEKDGQAPIIIKKVKKGGHDAHHGGAWKVAYADFVTAMMAFFLLMWLLNATTEEQQDGIADYFSPVSVSESTSGGGGMLSGQTVAEDGALQNRRSPMGVTAELPPTENLDSEEKKEAENSGATEAEGGTDGQNTAGGGADSAREEAERFESAQKEIRNAIARNPALQELDENVQVQVTDEGLQIQLVDQLNRPMFQSGGAEPLPQTRELLGRVAQAIGSLPNEVSIKGHTDATPFNREDYSNWELSADRANASRRIMMDAGLNPDRVDEVVGRADQDLLVPENPRSPRNRRISILLKRQEQPGSRAANGQNGTGAARATRNNDSGTTNSTGTGDGTQVGPSILDEN